jgi:hypothetical protein
VGDESSGPTKSTLVLAIGDGFSAAECPVGQTRGSGFDSIKGNVEIPCAMVGHFANL